MSPASSTDDSKGRATRHLLTMVLLAGLALSGCAEAAAATAAPLAAPRAPLSLPPRPAPCLDVRAGEHLQPILDAAREGDAICLAPGSYAAPVSVPPGVTLWGPSDAVIRSDGRGTTVTLRSRDRLLGLTVDGSGTRFDVLDAAIKLDKGEDVTIEGVTIERATFGILIEQAKRVTLVGNHVIGNGSTALGLRGDGIRLWETYDSLVERNLVEQSRDLVVWYSSRNVLKDNEVRHGRYGTHFMYSHGNRVERCRYLHNEVGIFIMYSRDIVVTNNTMLGATGAAGMGIGLKESGNARIEDNTLVDNTIGLFLDNSPITLGELNRFNRNVVRLGDVGISFLSTTHDNEFRDNELRDNHHSVRVESGGDALGLVWDGNLFDDYVGYDLDGDAIGDVPYELTDLGNALEAQNADLAFLRGTPALGLVSLAGHVVPLFTPKPVLRDPHPRLAPRAQSGGGDAS
ncbi:MAG: nitrous oxide reductase family maturation protein NosD [Deltaproteobacteria bacterium]|nr:nitrous oxide reductase family maturation protein NosD [Deltaproteobacteria bacterium]